MTLRALTLHQPWAMAVRHLGKPYENRSWRPPASAIGRPLAIHAGKTFDEDDAGWIFDNFGTRYIAADVPKGAVVAVCRLAGFIKSADEIPPEKRAWFFGPFGWVLEDVTPIEPVFCRGAQGIWVLKDSDCDEVRRRFVAARSRLAEVA